MSPYRLWVVAADEFRYTLRRPITWVLILIVAFLSWGISAGFVQIVISSGGATVGGRKAFLTSEFALTQILAVFSWLAYIFFVSVAAGLGVPRDDEARVLDVLQSTPLRPVEYAWGKFTGVFGAYAAVAAGNVLLLMLFLAVLPNAEMLETRGPFSAWNYLKPALVFLLPNVFFIAATSFAVGTAWRRPILVFALPVALLLFCSMFLWSWSPTWLGEGANRALMIADPAGLRWLRETWLNVDRGAAFYNTATVEMEGWFVATRVGWFLVGLGAVSLAVRRFARTARASHTVTGAQVTAALAAPAMPVVPGAERHVRMAVRQQAPGWWASLRMIAGAEARELRSQPGLYLFVPLILVQVLGTSFVSLGAFDAPTLRTPGQLASQQMTSLTAYVTLLLVFYAVEILERERSTRLSAITDAVPIGTGALLGGKALGLGVVVGVIVLASFVGSAILILWQGTVPFSTLPFLLLWGLLLLPTYFTVIAFVFAAYGVTRGRYGTYAIAFAAIGLSVWAGFSNRESWVTNWSLSQAVRWSDMSVLEWDRQALVWNRLFWLASGALCWRVAVRLYPRVDRDPVRFLQGGLVARRWRALRPSLPYILLAVVLGGMTRREISLGPDGSRAEKLGKDYWRKNLATWRDAPVPWVKDVQVDVRLEPTERAWKVEGSYLVVNHRDTTWRTVPLTVGRWRRMRFAVDGDSIKPDTASHLYLFTLPRALGPGDSVRLAFAYEGRHEGATRAGGGAGEFVQPSGVVMAGWSPQFFPYVGYVPTIGSDKDNAFEPRDYPEDYWQGVTPPLFGAQRPMTVRTRIDVPEEFRANGVGELVNERVESGRRITEFRTDVPVMAFNVVAGRWQVRRGEGTALFHHPSHTYNLDEMIDAMNQARRWYGEWFGTFPWKELRISEFPDLATYAQGFPTNITFSEGIGFLTKSEPKTNLAFLVTAHEIAHQWWGNMLQPGRGPGANLLSEGLAHFSTALLIEQVKGERNAIEFRKRIESRYGENRFADAERKLPRVDGFREGDNTLVYDKGGWVFWMLADRIGRAHALRGLKDLIARFEGQDDHPVLQDLVVHMRAYAPDTSAYDDFTRQWFDSVVVGEYKVDSATAVRRADGRWETRAVVRNVGTATMPIDIAAVRGERFPDDTTKRSVAYSRSMTRLVLAPAKAGQVIVIETDFEPERVVIDPDVRVLQLRRASAERKVSLAR